MEIENRIPIVLEVLIDKIIINLFVLAVFNFTNRLVSKISTVRQHLEHTWL